MPWYIIEVTIEKQSFTEFRAEDGLVYERMHGSTVVRSDEAELARVRCNRCGGPGHLARACPRPHTCFSCGNTGHQAFQCPQGRQRVGGTRHIVTITLDLTRLHFRIHRD